MTPDPLRKAAQATPLTSDEIAALRADIAKYPTPYDGVRQTDAGYDDVLLVRRLIATIDNALAQPAPAAPHLPPANPSLMGTVLRGSRDKPPIHPAPAAPHVWYGDHGVATGGNVPAPTAPLDRDALGTCDWGDCDSPAIVLRHADGHGWLPVCRVHADGNPSAEPYYLPMDCPVCGRRRMEWDGRVLSCEKCTTSSEWDGFSSDRYQPVPAAPLDPFAYEKVDPIECAICGGYTVNGPEVHQDCLDRLRAATPLPDDEVQRLKAYIRTEWWRVDDPKAQYDPLVRLSAIYARIDDWVAGLAAAREEDKP